MIQANEWRLGNWVEIVDMEGENSFHRQITGMDIVHFELEEKDPGNDLFSRGAPTDYTFPIDLTPEILIACGFILNGFKQYEITINNPKISCVPKKLYFAGDYLYLEEWRDNVKPHERDIVTIWNKDIMKQFYLHQLQNLYFALTAQELEYKP